MNPTPEPSSRSTILPRIGLVLAILLVFARATMTQGLRDPELVVPGAPAIPHDMGPAMGLVLDLLLCIPALLVLIQRAIDPAFRLRFHASSILFLILALLAAASGAWATDPFAAVVTGAHFVAAAVVMWSITQLVRSWAHVRLIGAVCFGILLICVAQSAIYRFVELSDLQREWQQTKTDQLARRGWAPDSFEARQFEIRVMAGELLGFNTSPNSFAALVVMLLVVSAGLVIQRVSDRDEPGWPMAIIALSATSLWVLNYTGSRTAAAACLFATGLFVVATNLRRRAVIYLCIVSVIVAGTALLVTYGISHNSLIHSSLTFRWYYWLGAMRIFLQHPLYGIGWGSFGDYYPAVRLPIASEEVKDPHNLLVRPLVELGTIGGLLMLGWLARMWWEITAPASLPKRDPAERRSPWALGNRVIFWIAGGAMLINIAGSIDFLLDSPGADGYIAMELFKRALFFALGLLGMGIALFRSTGGLWLDDRPATWTVRGMIIAVAAFLVCNLIDFSMYEPGPMCVMAMLIGTALAVKHQPPAIGSSSRALPILAACFGILLWLAAALGIAAAIAIAEQSAHEADALLRSARPIPAADRLAKAFDSLYIPNPDYAYRAAIANEYAQGPADRTRTLLGDAIRINPRSTTYPRARIQLDLRQPQPQSAPILQDFQRLLTLDPNNVATRLSFADTLNRFGNPSQAITEYREALRFNSLLAPDEPKRLTPSQIDEVQRRIQGLGG